jgi:hypothetical protein
MYGKNMSDYVNEVETYLKGKGRIDQLSFREVPKHGLYIFPYFVGENAATGYQVYDREDFEEQVWTIINKILNDGNRN